MPRRIALSSLLVGILCYSGSGWAQGRRGATYSTDKSFGLGLMVGDPAGLTAKYYLGGHRRPVALDFGVGYSYHYRHGEGVHLHMDVLWHPVLLTTQPSFVMPLYLGLGARYWEHDDYTNDGVVYDGHARLGVRAPIGIAMDFTRVPLDVFFEIALVVDVIYVNDDDYRRGLDWNGSLGVRYYF